jgi:acyl-CoA synthetase (AMP-forming)/AMP-acid ligase II
MIDNTTLREINPVFSGHETFPMRYGWLKKVYDACLSIEKRKKGAKIRDFFNNEEAIVTLGVGKNMVSSMKHWAIYTSLLDFDKNKDFVINGFARDIFKDDGHDPWLENYATLWFIHWNLAARKQQKNHLYTYLWFFNCLNGNTFDKDTLLTRIIETTKTYGLKESSPSTIKRDIECFLGMYSSRNDKEKTSEDNIESPLTELELISPLVRRNLFQINRGIKPTISIYTFLFALFKFWDYYSPNSKTLSFESICYNFMSPGRIFLLNEDAIIEYLQILSDETRGAFEYTETAGMKQIILNSNQNKNLDKWAIHYFRKNYK